MRRMQEEYNSYGGGERSPEGRFRRRLIDGVKGNVERSEVADGDMVEEKLWRDRIVWRGLTPSPGNTGAEE